MYELAELAAQRDLGVLDWQHAAWADLGTVQAGHGFAYSTGQTMTFGDLDVCGVFEGVVVREEDGTPSTFVFQFRPHER